ncbi:MAG: DNA polymerase IV [Alphaproteobacteria bacterium]
MTDTRAAAPPIRGLCRDCFRHLEDDAARCPACGSRRIKRHDELFDLAIAHIDCDAFYATVEKRDNPDLRDKPVIVGGGKRGVVSAACYVARIYGVRSAMPMFKALAACPNAVVIRPNIKKYAEAGQRVRRLMLDVTPSVEPISIDEAFLDLSGTERLHHAPPAETLARLVKRVEDEVGVTASIGLSYNKFLAKVASDLDKPRGFAVIGRAEAVEFLRNRPVTTIWGVGPALNAQLAQHGIEKIGQLLEHEENDLIARFGSIGRRLARFARGEDARSVSTDDETKSVSAETTFNRDLAQLAMLKDELWPLCEKVAARLKKAELAGRTLTLKLKSAKFKTITRRCQLPAPTQLAESIYRGALPLLERETSARLPYRLIGVGLSDFTPPQAADPGDLLDPDATKRAKVERTMDLVRAKMGADAIRKGRGLGKPAAADDDDED